MRRINVIIILLVLVALGLWVLTFRQDREASVSSGGNLRVGEASIQVEIADTAQKQAQGLSGRESLAEEAGMLFVFGDSRQRSFWMSKMRFPLDMVFIGGGRVVEIVSAVPAPGQGEDGKEIRVISQEPAEWVLEVNGGWADRHGIRVGDRVELF
jgi:uncharacterized protein